jgi:uncharacterized protein YjiS (DUF1127 family)
MIMRDYVLTQSMRHSGRSGLGTIQRLIRNWTSRHAVAKLEKLSDHQLRDVGLSRDDLLRLKSLPLDVDPASEMERLRFLSSRQPHRTQR